MTTTLRRLATSRSIRLMIAMLAVILVAEQESGPHSLRAAAQNPIPDENVLPGDSDWDISGAGDPTIQGFATDISINNTESAHFKIASAGPYRIDINRAFRWSMCAIIVINPRRINPKIFVPPSPLPRNFSYDAHEVICRFAAE